MIRRTVFFVFLLLSGLFFPDASAVQRFPKPEFESGYTTPETQLPLPRGELLIWMDLFILFASLSLATYLILKKRSRQGVFWLSLFCLAYFGFYREGCVCSIGAIQNISLGLFNGSYVVPLVVLFFFLLPLIFTLLFGRTFCAAVCPFGAIQDLVSFKPLKIAPWLNSLLTLVPYLYLGLAVLFSATATDFIICRYDPFVGIFRLNATLGMYVFAGILLLSGIVIVRPYCRFLCPYGVLLNWMSRFSWKHMTITPSECIRCKLCEDVCPYDAIEYPQRNDRKQKHPSREKQFIILLFLLPVFILIGVWTGSKIHPVLAGVNSKVKLSRMIIRSEISKEVQEIPEIIAFKSSGISRKQLFEDAALVEKEFMTGSKFFGGFIGLVFGIILIGFVKTPFRNEYVPNRGTCFSCAKCMDYCPVKQNDVEVMSTIN